MRSRDLRPFSGLNDWATPNPTPATVDAKRRVAIKAAPDMSALGGPGQVIREWERLDSPIKVFNDLE